MNQEYCNTEEQKGKHLCICERKEIEKSLAKGYGIRQIARALGRAPSTISREVKRGSVLQRKKVNSYSKKTEVPLEITEVKYFADNGQRIAASNIGNRGGKYKLLSDSELIKHIEEQILCYKRSPDAVIGALKVNVHSYSSMVCTKTVYNYIDKGLLAVKNIDLMLKVRRKPKLKRNRKNKRALGKSIELRPEWVGLREEFGHFEGDTIVGKDGRSAVLTLVERKTRKGFMLSLKDKDSKSVMKALNKFCREICSKKVVKSITFDNGSEFAKCSKLERRGIAIYYAHPYSAYERGSNENYNGIIRRFIPKGKDLNTFSQADLNRINNWIDTLPRKSLDYKSAEILFSQELGKISVHPAG